MILDKLYDGTCDLERGRAVFGKQYSPPETFTYGEWYAVARYEKESEDGQPVEIDESRLPTRFYRLRALPSTDSCGKAVKPFALTTGSGDDVAHLLVKLAKEITSAMVQIVDHAEAE